MNEVSYCTTIDVEFRDGKETIQIKPTDSRAPMLHRNLKLNFQKVQIVTFIIHTFLCHRQVKAIAYFTTSSPFQSRLNILRSTMPRRKLTVAPCSNEDIATPTEGNSEQQILKRKVLTKDELPTIGHDSEVTTNAETVKLKRKKATEPQSITEKDDLPKLWNEQESRENLGSYTFKIISWNVAGLRALLSNHPDALPSLVRRYNPDVICLQETKLQDIHLHDEKLNIKGNLLCKEGYDCVFNCSVKKGYSGTAVIWKKWLNTVSPHIVAGKSTSNLVNVDKKKSAGIPKGGKKQADISKFFSMKGHDSSQDTVPQDSSSTQPSLEAYQKYDGDVPIEHLVPTSIYPDLGMPEHDQEGRVLTMDYPLFSLTNVYVPNSGAELKRLDERINSWDPALLSFMKQKHKTRGKPVIWLGDLNVAHTNLDCWNDGAKHLLKTPGTTKEEKDSFTRTLNDNNCAFVDAFRFLHPTAKGYYTYWSQRAGNRLPNKGLRIDYFICSRELMEDNAERKVVVRDSYMVTDQSGSDHCPIVLEMEIKK